MSLFFFFLLSPYVKALETDIKAGYKDWKLALLSFCPHLFVSFCSRWFGGMKEWVLLLIKLAHFDEPHIPLNTTPVVWNLRLWQFGICYMGNGPANLICGKVVRLLREIKGTGSFTHLGFCSLRLPHSNCTDTNCKNKANDNLGKGVISSVRFPFSVCGYCLQCLWENVGWFSHKSEHLWRLGLTFSLPVEDCLWPTVDTFSYDFYLLLESSWLPLFCISFCITTWSFYNCFVQHQHHRWSFVYTFQGRTSIYEAVERTQVTEHVWRTAYPSALLVNNKTNKQTKTIRKKYAETKGFRTKTNAHYDVHVHFPQWSWVTWCGFVRLWPCKGKVCLLCK